MVSFKKGNTFKWRIVLYMCINIILSLFVLSLYDFTPKLNTYLFIILIPIVIAPVFLNKDIMNPFNIFLISSQFLFIFNMIDINANKDFFRYGMLSSNYYEVAFTWAILIILMWYVCMYLGYFYTFEKQSKNKELRVFEIRNSTSIAIILIVLGTISYLVITYLKGGLSGILEGLSNRRESYAGLSYFIKLTSLVSIGAIMLLHKGYKRISMILIVLSFLMLSSFGGRSAAFFGSVFPFLLFYHYRVKKIRFTSLIPVGFIGVIFAIALGNYRQYNEFRLEFNGIYGLLSKVASGTQGGEILPSLTGSLIQGNIDYQYGKTMINIIFAPIPSSIWANKPPIDESGLVGRLLMGSEYWGLPPGPYGISFLNFGFIGVIIIGFLTGILVKKLYYIFIIKEKSNYLSLIFYVFIIRHIFDFLSTSSQINILWYILVFVFIKILDISISLVKSRSNIKSYV